MAEKEFLGDRRRASENEYFHRQERELIDKLRQRSQDAAARREMVEKSGVADEEILRDLKALGYTPETVTLLHLVPLLQIAWAEGSISDRERELILEAAAARGIQTGSPAHHQLINWLTDRPSEELFEKTLRAIAAVLEAIPASEREDSQRDLLSRSAAIASASGGILGFGKVSPREHEVLARITQELEHTGRRPHTGNQ